MNNLMRKHLLLPFCLALAAIFAAPPAFGAAPMTNADVILLVKSGVNETNIIAAIQQAGNGFDTSPAGLASLAQAKVSQNIIDAINKHAPPPATAAPNASAQGNDKVAKTLDELQTLKDTQSPKNLSLAERVMEQDKRRQLIAAKTHALYTANPGDPRRWEAVALMFANAPSFFKSTTDTGPTSYSSVTDTAAKTQWQQRADKILADSRKATDVPDSAREPIGYYDVDSQLNNALKAVNEVERAAMRNRKSISLADRESVNLASPVSSLKAYLALQPGNGIHAMELLQKYLMVFRRVKGGKANEADAIKPLADTPNTTVHDYIAKSLAVSDRLKKPVDMTFTALDGREVDVSRMRGKVVLVYFCTTADTADLPFLKDAYSTYHEKGFEIVGIFLDGSSRSTVRSTRGNGSADRQKILDFIDKQKLPWPQYYDGQGNQTAYAVLYGISGMRGATGLLLDKNGVVAAQGSEASGAKLAPVIEKLLKQ